MKSNGSADTLWRPPFPEVKLVVLQREVQVSFWEVIHSAIQILTPETGRYALAVSIGNMRRAVLFMPRRQHRP